MNSRRKIFYERFAADDYSAKKIERYRRNLSEEDKQNIEIIKKENDHIRKTCPMDIYKHQILRKAKLRVKAGRPEGYLPVKVAMSAASFLLVILGVVYFIFPPQSSILPKGDAETALHIYRKIPGGYEEIKNFTFTEVGDQLQIVYRQEKTKYGAVFSIDGKKNITLIYPAATGSLELVVAPLLEGGGEKIALPFSYTLDDAPQFEIIFFVTSDSPFQVEKMAREILDSFSFNCGEISIAGSMDFIILLKNR